MSDQLSAQQMQIAELVSQGLNNEEIAHRLFISHRTVASHLDHIYPLFGVANRAQLADAVAAAISEEGGDRPAISR